MSALVQVNSYHGASSFVGVNGGRIRFSVADLDFPRTVLDDSLLVPSTDAAFLYTLPKVFRLNCISGAHLSINNAMVYFSNKLPSWRGVDIFVTTSASYVNPATQGQTALTGFVNNSGSYTYTSPLVIPNGAIAAATSGVFGDYVLVQARIRSSAIPGLPEDYFINFRFEEWT